MQSQCNKIVSYIQQNGSITSMEAFDKIGCTRLSGRINDLRRRGYDIETVSEKAMNRDGRIITYGRYFIRQSPETGNASKVEGN